MDRLQIIVLILMTLIIALILPLLFMPKDGKKGRPGKKRKKTGPPLPGPGKEKTCPLCSMALAKGERIKSVMYPGGSDRIMEIHGCPHCNPPNERNRRICPVCLKEVPKAGYVIARLFIRADNGDPRRKKNHVHVLGCTGCYRRS